MEWAFWKEAGTYGSKIILILVSILRSLFPKLRVIVIGNFYSATSCLMRRASTDDTPNQLYLGQYQKETPMRRWGSWQLMKLITTHDSSWQLITAHDTSWQLMTAIARIVYFFFWISEFYEFLRQKAKMKY